MKIFDTARTLHMQARTGAVMPLITNHDMGIIHIGDRQIAVD